MYKIIICLLIIISISFTQNSRLSSELENYFKTLDESSIPDLIELVIKSTKPVKIAAIKALGEMKSQSAADILTAVLSFWYNNDLFEKNYRRKYILDGISVEFDDEVRAEAALALGKINRISTIQYITKALLADPYSNVKINCLKSLGMIKRKESIPYIQLLLNDALLLHESKIDNNIVIEAIKALGEIGSTQGFIIAVKITQSEKLKADTKKEVLKYLENIKWN